MANILPTDLFPGFVVLSQTSPAPADGIFIPFTALPYLTQAEANPTTGDGREVARQLDFTINEAIVSLPIEDRPSAMTSGTSITTLSDGNRRVTLTRTYTLTAPIMELSLVDEA
jgi:hypothetical protein